MTPTAKRLITFIMLALTGCLLLFSTTSPDNVPSAAFIGVFIMIYGILYSLFTLVGLMLRHFGVIEWSSNRVRQTALAVAGYPVFLVVLQSIGQLTVRDVILVTGFSILAYLYVSRVFLVPKHNA